MPVGPGASEVERLRDTVNSLEYHEPDGYLLMLVDDAPQDRRLKEAVGELESSRVVILKNPRNGRGDGWSAGCTAGVLAGLKLLAARSVKFALKLDTDALVIRPFSAAVAAKFDSTPGLGMVGSRYYAEGYEPGQEWIRGMGVWLEKLMRQFAIWRCSRVSAWPVLQIGCWGKYREIRNVIRSAFINGFRVGDHCQGGSYALSGELLAALDRDGHLDDPLRWLWTPVTDDHTIALLVKALDFQLCDFGGKGGPFACHWRGLPDTPENLLNCGAAIIHSVKDHGKQTEAATRKYFKELRQAGDRVQALGMRG